MAFYYTKELLYNVIHVHKMKTGLSINEYGFDMIELCNNVGIKIDSVPFKTKALRGMAAIGRGYKKDVILLNTERNSIEQNYDCGHEFIHLRIHRDLRQETFHCIDSSYQANQDPFIEWQANEGAAEFIVPYISFIPLVIKCRNDMKTSSDIISFKEYAANIYNVSRQVIGFRLESLKYEIDQCLNGADVRNIKLLSAAQQKRSGIHVRSINDLETDMLDKEYGWSESSFINFNAISM